MKNIRCNALLLIGAPVKLNMFPCKASSSSLAKDYFLRVIADGGTLEAGGCVTNFLNYLN